MNLKSWLSSQRKVEEERETLQKGAELSGGFAFRHGMVQEDAFMGSDVPPMISPAVPWKLIRVPLLNTRSHHHTPGLGWRIHAGTT